MIEPVEELGGESAGALVAALERACGVLIAGGGNLCASWPHLARQRTAAVRAARRLGRPVVFGGQTLGPTLAPGQAADLGGALQAAEVVGVRDLPSAALALRLGVAPERICYQEDDGLLLATTPPASIPGWIDEPWVGVSLDASFAARGQRESLRRLAGDLAVVAGDLGLRPVFLSHLGPRSGSVTGHHDDRTGESLAQLLAGHGVACERLPPLPPRCLAWLSQRAAAILSSRFHGLVFATAGAVPGLGIHRDAYTRVKLQGALAHFDLAEWTLSATAIEEGQLLPRFRDLWSRRDAMRATMLERRSSLVAASELRWRRFAAALGIADDRLGELESSAPPPLVLAALAALGRERDAAAAEEEKGAAWRASRRKTQSMPTMGRRSPRTVQGEEPEMVSEQQWSDYLRDGYLRLGAVLDLEEVRALCDRADDLALGRVSNPEVEMQLDTGGDYEQLPGAVRAFAEGTHRYRKIQGLQHDALYSRLLRLPLFAEIAARHYGRHASVSIFRAMVMNKPAGQGTYLPWHQDGGDVWKLDRDPLVTIWVALDPATRANGCLEVVPGTHRLGLLTTYGSTVRDEDVARHCPAERVLPLEVEAGHALLLHNWLIHRSGINPSPVPRRAFTACYMDGRALSTLTGQHFPLVFGEEPSEEHLYLAHLRGEHRSLREAVRGAEEHIRGLEGENARLRQMREEAERYALTLEAERRKADAGSQGRPTIATRLRRRLTGRA